MDQCLNCGRALAGNEMPANLCPECHSLVQSQPRPAPRSRRNVLAEMPVTTGIVGLNVLVYLAMTFSGVSALEPTTPDLLKWGALSGIQTLYGQPWRILTSNYVHIGLLHIALNMWCLWNLGALAERVFDRWTYFLTYTVCGLAGSIVSLWFHPIGVGAGASGAIFGLAGALITALYLAHLPIHPQALKATMKSLLSFAGYNLFFGSVVRGIDNSAHIGGLLSGLILGAALAPHLTSPREERNSWRSWIFIAAALVLAVGFRIVKHAVLRRVITGQ